METPKKSGFTLGVILGAVVGTGALILSSNKEGKKIKEQMLEKIHDLKEKYPDQIQGIEDVLGSALSEAKDLTNELKSLKTSQPKPAKKKTNTFKRFGKSVQ